MRNLSDGEKIKEIKDKIKKRLERRAFVENNANAGYNNYNEDDGDISESKKQNLSYDEAKKARKWKEESEEEKIERIRKKARNESEKAVKKGIRTGKIKDPRAAIMLRQLDKVAYSISSKMAKEAKKGGLHSVLPIAMTYVFALGKDIIDCSGYGSIAGILTGIFAWSVISMFWIQVSGGWKGGIIKRRIIKKILVKFGVVFAVEAIPGLNIIPTWTVINLWSHYDFKKDIRKAKNNYINFMEEYKRKRKSIISRSTSRRIIRSTR